MPARRLDHVAVNVPDIDEAVSFFRAAFGARLVFELPRFGDAALGRLGARPGASLALAMLDLGGASLELLEWRADPDSAMPAAWPATEALGVAHVAVEVDDVEATLNGLRALDGVSVVGEPTVFNDGPTPGLVNAFVRAPWGLLVELVCWPRGPA